ncbi:MAG: LPS assembly lipoprotein LptE [Bacteroidota bacterium]
MKNKNTIRLKGQDSRYKSFLKLGVLLLVCCALYLVPLTSCNIYKFTEASPVPDSIKTIRVNQFEYRARYVNVQLSPKLTDKLRQKIVGQTRLSQTNSDNADWEIMGTITDYSLSTSAISGQKEVNNRLTVGVRIVLNRRKDEIIENYDVSRSFEFPATKSLQQAEASLADEMVRSLTDEIFNKIFSKW